MCIIHCSYCTVATNAELHISFESSPKDIYIQLWSQHHRPQENRRSWWCFSWSDGWNFPLDTKQEVVVFPQYVKLESVTAPLTFHRNHVCSLFSCGNRCLSVTLWSYELCPHKGQIQIVVSKHFSIIRQLFSAWMKGHAQNYIYMYI